jgi:alanine-glyoxylate transaminase/serine-glyoxylate transaminase/serine-pyruvate transaminase
MGPGPTEVHPRVLRAMGTPLLGYLDPAFVEIMDEVQALLRYAFRTDNDWTLPISGTGSAAMETAFGNLVEPGETVLVPSNGYFGGRMGKMARRAGGEVVTVDAPWGEPLDAADVADAFDAHQPDVFGFVHAETSTGVRQPDVPALVDIAHEHDAYAIVDCVTSLGGVEFRADEWNVDAAYSCSQKCLSCPPGASPVTFSDRAREKVLAREESSGSWYLDVAEIMAYWGEERSYHHTAPTTNVYALREGLRLVAEEGIENRWDRHRRMAGALRAGVEAMGVDPVADESYWLPSLTTVRVPGGVDDAAVGDYLLDAYDLEIGGGLGDLAGEVFRLGCMGYSARPANVAFLLSALGDALDRQGATVDVGAGMAAMRDRLAE